MIASICMCLAASLGNPSGDAVPEVRANAPLSLTESLEAQGAPGMLEQRGGLPPSTMGPPPGPRRWREGQTLMQGYFGVMVLEELERSGGAAPPVGGSSSSSSSSMPTIGGGAMYKLGGKRLDWGVEGMIGFSGSGNVQAFYFGGGGAAVAVDVDMLVFDLYGGPFVSMFLGDKLRIYGALGPVMEWVNYDQSGPGPADAGSGSGFGFGGYARCGAEVLLGRSTLVGLAGRWSETQVDLGGGLGDLKLGGLQAVLTVTTGL